MLHFSLAITFSSPSIAKLWMGFLRPASKHRDKSSISRKMLRRLNYFSSSCIPKVLLSWEAFLLPRSCPLPKLQKSTKYSSLYMYALARRIFMYVMFYPPSIVSDYIARKALQNHADEILEYDAKHDHYELIQQTGDVPKTSGSACHPTSSFVG